MPQKQKKKKTMSPATNFKDLLETFICLVDNIQKLIKDQSRSPKVKLNNCWNKIWENTANVPNPSFIGGQFELSICITTRQEWLASKFGQINQKIFEATEGSQWLANMTALASQPARAAKNPPIIYTKAIGTDCLPYSTLLNPRKFVINPNLSAWEVTITKIKHNIILKEYVVMIIVNTTIQLFLPQVFGTKIFADMLTSDSFVLNKYTALQI